MTTFETIHHSAVKTNDQEIKGALAGMFGWLFNRPIFTELSDSIGKNLKTAQALELEKDISAFIAVEPGHKTQVYDYWGNSADLSVPETSLGELIMNPQTVLSRVDLAYAVKHMTVKENHGNLDNIEIYKELWNFVPYTSGYIKGGFDKTPEAGKRQLLKYYGSIHNADYTDVRQIPEIVIARQQLMNSSTYCYGKNRVYAHTVNSRHAILETLRHINLLGKNGVVHYGGEDHLHHWWVKEHPSCEGEVAKAIKEEKHCLEHNTYNNGMHHLVTKEKQN